MKSKPVFVHTTLNIKLTQKPVIFLLTEFNVGYITDTEISITIFVFKFSYDLLLCNQSE